MTFRFRFLHLAGLCAVTFATQAHAAEAQACSPSVLALLARSLNVAHFVPRDADPNGVVLATSCKGAPDDAKLTLAAVAWDAHAEDSKDLALAVIDESASTLVALLKDGIPEDASTQVNNGSLRLDTAPYVLAPGVRAFGLDVFQTNGSCGEGGSGPLRTLYVREGRTLRPVLADLPVSEYWYVRGNQRRCTSSQKEADTAILEDFAVTISVGAPGKGGWRDLVLTATSRRSDHRPGRTPLRVTVPYDGQAYPLQAFDKTYRRWRQ